AEMAPKRLRRRWDSEAALDGHSHQPEHERGRGHARKVREHDRRAGRPLEAEALAPPHDRGNAQRPYDPRRTLAQQNAADYDGLAIDVEPEAVLGRLEHANERKTEERDGEARPHGSIITGAAGATRRSLQPGGRSLQRSGRNRRACYRMAMRNSVTK